MVNETIEIASHILDFNLETLAAQQQQQQTQLQRSSSNSSEFTAIALQQQKSQQPHDHQQQKNLLSVSLNSNLLPSSTENLSWKFFEQVSSLDNQLRNGEGGNEESNATQVNGCNLMNSIATVTKHNNTTYDANSHIVTAAVNEEQQQHQMKTIACKSNGFANIATISDDDILSQQQQQSPDLIPQQQYCATFQFTSPTATFKRKKHQQQQKQQQQKFINNNYNNQQQANSTATTAVTIENYQLQTPSRHITSNNCIHTSIATTTTGTAAGITINELTNNISIVKQQQQQQQQPQPRNATTTTTMITGAGVRNFDTAAATTTTRAGIAATSARSAKTRTLPIISTTAPAAAGTTTTTRLINADNLHLVDVTQTNTTSNNCLNKQQQSAKQARNSMGATLHSNNNGGNTSGSSSGRGGDGGARIVGGNNNKGSQGSFVNDIEMHLGLIGWRKKCLYTLLVLLMLLIITNLVLTLWILKVMEFSTDGMGQLKIVPGGIQLTGQTLIMDMLRASTIRSRHGQPIVIESSRNFSINTRDTNGMLENHLFLGHDKLECLSTGFRITNTSGRNLFSVNRDEVTIGAHALRIDGEGGAIFRESVQTPHVRAEAGHELRLESPTRQLELTAARDINMQSRAGGIEMTALNDIKLSALDGSLRLETNKILMPNLRTAIPSDTQNRDHLHHVFQLCACANGKLFLASPHSICAIDDATICR